MPEYLKALLVILLLAGTVFSFYMKPCSAFVARHSCKRWRNTWISLSIIAFLAHSFWLYALATALILSFIAQRERDPVAPYFLTLFLIPAGSVDIPGFGVINYLFSFNHIILITLVLLLPAFFRLQGRTDTTPFGRPGIDKVLAAYLLLMTILNFRDATITGAMREMFYLFMGTFLPYYVISRSVKTVEDFRRVTMALGIALMVLAAIAIFEGAKHWLLYAPLVSLLDLQWGFSRYLGRADMLRAQATAGQPIALGYLMVIGLGIAFYLKEYMPKKLAGRVMITLLAGGLAATFSRGPWVGAAVLILVFTALGPNAPRRMTTLVFSAFLIFAILAILPGGEKIIDLLPWIGNVDKGSTEYRQRVFDGSIITIMRNPLFGSVDFTVYPEMHALMQGEHIIDIVNTYLLIALRYGLLVMSLFVLFFILVAWGVFKKMRKQPIGSESRLYGRSLIATLVGLLATIATVSDITIISVVYWSMAGLGVAYIRSSAMDPIETGIVKIHCK
jgi:hypothetical protein